MAAAKPIVGKRIFITGGAGFIGSHLTRRLADRNRIFIYDNLSRNAMRHFGLARHPRVKLIRGDVRDLPRLRRHLRGMDYVFHMASIAGVDAVMRAPVSTMEINLFGTYNVATTALRQCPKLVRFVDFSTSEVFGALAYKVSEGDVTSLGAVGETRWTYAVSKVAMEHYLMTLRHQEGFPAASIRPFNIYGPAQAGVGAIKTFIQRAIRNEPIVIHNAGDQIRSWCYIDDIVEATLKVLEPARSTKVIGQALNIGNPAASLSIYQLATLVKRIAGSRSPIRRRRWQETEVELRIPDITKARQLLGWRPKVSLDEGIARTIEFFRAHPEG